MERAFMKKMISYFIFSLLGIAIAVPAFAFPAEVILIRHADKLNASNDGLFLIPKGQVRAERFSDYYLKTYVAPDYIFATVSADEEAAKVKGKSYRPIQTIAPLANQLLLNGATFETNFDYLDENYTEMTSAIMKNPMYQGKIILICWHHGLLNKIAIALGVQQQVLPKWPGSVYDTVYVIKYDKYGAVKSFQILPNQYPVIDNPTWNQLQKPFQ